MLKIIFASLFIIISRLLPHPFNFSPVICLALVSPLFLNGRISSLSSITMGMLISDCLLGAYNTMPFVYGALIVITFLGGALKGKLSLFTLSLSGFGSCGFFYLITNFGSWLTMPIYAKTAEGLLACYVNAIPFFQHSLMATGFYLTIFYLAFANYRHPERSEGSQGDSSLAL